jgi:hypothetical protein
LEQRSLRGQKLVDNEVERGHRPWARPTDIARLLLMRRLPKTISAHTRLEQFRVLGAILPELDDVVAEKQIILPSPASPVLPLHLRPGALIFRTLHGAVNVKIYFTTRDESFWA